MTGVAGSLYDRHTELQLNEDSHVAKQIVNQILTTVTVA